MIRITNMSRRVQTVELASSQSGCYTGRRGQWIVPTVDLLPGATSAELPAAVAELPAVVAKRRAGIFRVRAVAKKASLAKSESKGKSKGKGRSRKAKGSKKSK